MAQQPASVPCEMCSVYTCIYGRHSDSVPSCHYASLVTGTGPTCKLKLLYGRKTRHERRSGLQSCSGGFEERRRKPPPRSKRQTNVIGKGVHVYYFDVAQPAIIVFHSAGDACHACHDFGSFAAQVNSTVFLEQLLAGKVSGRMTKVQVSK